MTRQERIAFLEGTDNHRYTPSLAREFELLSALGDPQKRLRFVHVAGTNGKGSACACLASILQAAGYRTGLFTSPHIFEYEERIAIDGMPIDAARFSLLLERIRPVVENMAQRPTTFELLTAAAFLYFAEEKCDIVVLEVGMGGRFDATNVITSPLCTVVTPIGLDHTAQLGNSVEAIAGEKSGIIKPHTRVVCAAEDPRAVAIVKKTCEERDAAFFGVDFSRITDCRFAPDGTVMSLEPYGEIRLPLLGTYQPRNALTAITACEILDHGGVSVPDRAILQGLAEVVWRGRFELLRRDPLFILDGAHNAHGIAAAAESLKTYFPDEKVTFLLGILADKDVDTMLSLLLPLAARFVVVTPPSSRAMDSVSLAACLRESGAQAQVCRSVREGVQTAISLAGKSGRVCALGSLYFSGDVRNAVFERKE